MEVITSHVNADLDTLASMTAAAKLYPGARLVFSGSVEKKVKEALLRFALPYAFEYMKDFAHELGSVTRIILVDVKDPARTGRFAGIIGKPGVEVHVYDHHMAAVGGLSASFTAIEPYGSTTTVLAHIIREKKISLTPADATVMMAGIYEDTGSLCYPSTTIKDYEAAAFLLSKGADLRAVGELLKRELTSREVSALNEFLHNETVYSAGGAEIVIAEGKLEKSSGDVASLAQRIREIEGADCLFVLADAGDRIHMAARSAAPEVDVGAVARALGGGGHPTAASATFKDMTLVQAKEALVSAIMESVAPLRKAGDIMSYPPLTADAGAQLQDAVEFMRRYNINAAPVLKGQRVAGVITRQVADKAVHHGLGASPVSDYATAPFDWVEHDTPVEKIREMVIGRGQRLLPVLKDKKLVGVITRTDLLKLLQEELGKRPEGKLAGRRRAIAGLMRERLPKWLFDILADAGRSAEEIGVRAFVVGGFVRDLIMRREDLDVDIVIEGGDGIRFAEAFAAKRGLRVRPHTRFRTAVVIFPDGYKLDVATARLEYYEKPGALPTVEQSSLKLDLYRRDFIINTLAVALNPKRFGDMTDFFGAERDIKEKTIRVLHNLSFVEDPTRVLRAVRFSEKFGFRIDRHTLNLIKNAVKLDVFRRVSGPRMLEELKSILSEESAARAVSALHGLGVLGLIHNALAWDVDREFFFEKTREALAWHRLLYTKDVVEEWLTLYLALTDALEQAEFSGLSKRLGIAGRKSDSVINAREDGLRALGRISTGLVQKNSALYGLLSPLPLEVVIYLLAKAQKEPAKKALAAYVTRLKTTSTELKGNDLKKMGIKQGRVIGEVLQAVFQKRLDGEILTRADEEVFVKKFLKRLDK